MRWLRRRRENREFLRRAIAGIAQVTAQDAEIQRRFAESQAQFEHEFAALNASQRRDAKITQQLQEAANLSSR